MASPLALGRRLPAARARIFAFAHAGGGASAFSRLRAALAEHDVELCPLQPAGRENRWDDAPSPSVEAMAREFADAIGGLAELPFALLGHSFGGLVAYVTASVLHQRGLAPMHFIASGSVAPQTRREATDHLDSGAFRRRMLDLGGIPEAILENQDLYAMFEVGIRHDMRLGNAVRLPQGYILPCPVTVYCGNKDRAAPPQSAGAWQRFATGAIRRRIFDGGHFFLYSQSERVVTALVHDIDYKSGSSLFSRAFL